MANRPTMSKMQREIEKLKKEQFQTNLTVQRHEEELKRVQRREIIRMLQEKNTPRSTRFRFTYEEIAQEMGCSSATVSNIAKEEGLSRRLGLVE